MAIAMAALTLQAADANYHVVPLPQSITAEKGAAFTLDANTAVFAVGADEAMQRNAAEHAARANRANGGNAGTKNLLLYGKAYQFKKGERQKDKMSAEAFDAMHRQIGEQRKHIIKAEKRRVLFGLEQKTKLRVVQAPKEKICLRNGLRKKGYEIARASNEAFITAATHRSEVMERRAMSMGISFTTI